MNQTADMVALAALQRTADGLYSNRKKGSCNNQTSAENEEAPDFYCHKESDAIEIAAGRSQA